MGKMLLLRNSEGRACMTSLVLMVLVLVSDFVLAMPPPQEEQVVTTIAASETDAENVDLEIRPRSSWNASEPREIHALKFSPAPFVVLHHTYIPGWCDSAAACEEAMRAMQHFHMVTRGWFDIGYNFAIGGDGAVYEARGWGREGAHAPRYNDKSVGICFIGDFRTSLPSPVMLHAARSLISLGVREGHIRSDYALFGHRQVRDTECPGDALFAELSTWPHFRPAAPQIQNLTASDVEAFLVTTPQSLVA